MRLGGGLLKKAWFSDPATYPLLLIIGGGFVFATGVSIACLSTNPDVQLTATKRNSVLRTWED